MNYATMQEGVKTPLQEETSVFRRRENKMRWYVS